MPTYIGRGAAEAQLRSDLRKSEKETERWRQEQLIIKHVEKATHTKVVEIDGELKYIPVETAEKLGLL